MEPNGLIPLQLVFGTIRNNPTKTQTKPTQAKCFQAIKVARSDMETINEENLMKVALQSKLISVTSYLMCSGNKVRLYRESIRTCNVLYKTKKVP